MAKCPKCNKQIFELIEVSTVIKRQGIRLARNPKEELVLVASLEDPEYGDDAGEVINYECPSCEEIVCDNLEEVKRILQGGGSHV